MLSLAKLSSLVRKQAMIRVYSDKGACDLSSDALAFELGKRFPCVQKVDSRFLKSVSWETTTSALIMGGGTCSIWEQDLGQKGMEKIRDFVLKGGKFVGFCAGAYFAAPHSLFSFISSPPLEKNRPLKFFEGKAIGPLIPTDNPLGKEAAMAIPIKIGNTKGYCYYQSGCYFETVDETEILAYYDKPFDKPAMIKKKSALLCGFHPEFSWENLGSYSDPIFGSLVDALTHQEAFRLLIWQKVVDHLSQL
ncbi:MAG: hypothetical protein JSR58_01510 [Verrucomicrobia bacterium]|nr:hypothetical protein [Verrucomicrobiota bacterium]